MIAPDTIREGAAALGVVLGAAAASRLSELAALLVRWNQAYNLISSADVGRILPRHLLDSLALLPYLHGERVLDVGTGAGFPGLPLAIAAPERTFVVLDRSERKLRFVRQARIELAIDNVEVVCSDVASYQPRFRFDTVVARALAAPATVWKAVERLLAPEGRAVLACGDPAKAALPADACIERHRIAIPGLDEPHWVLVVRAPEAPSASGTVHP